MFEDAPLTAASPGVGPVAAGLVAWHADRGEWVALEPCDVVDPDLQAQMDGSSKRCCPPKTWSR